MAHLQYIKAEAELRLKEFTDEEMKELEISLDEQAINISLETGTYSSGFATLQQHCFNMIYDEVYLSFCNSAEYEALRKSKTIK